MKYIDEFRNKNLVAMLTQRIKEIAPPDNINLMEVCGTHTQSFRRFGLDKLLPDNIRLIAGPGCPVCVSAQAYLDNAIALGRQKDIIILTFGDMLRIPGTNSSLEKERAQGANAQVVYSAYDSLKIAKAHPAKKIIFLAVGFETTAPTIALSILAASKQRLKNLYFFSALKLIPPAMGHLLKDKRLNIQGFLCPGHVSTVIGTKPYEFIPKRYKINCCIAGFEPLDILEGIYFLLQQITEKRPQVTNQYSRVVTKQGNVKAKKIISQVFKVCDTSWRGLGKIPDSGLKIRKEFCQFDAEQAFSINHESRILRQAQDTSSKDTEQSRSATNHESRCRCGDILKGLLSPLDCPLFSKICNPDNPIGPCMVSTEGTCNAYYKYR